MFTYQPKIKMAVRSGHAQASIIDVSGELNGAAEEQLMAAYNQASSGGMKNIILNMTKLEYMNSSGIGLLVTLLVRSQRQQQRLIAYGLSEHYRQIFELTRLDQAIALCEDEATALAVAANAG